MSIKAASALDPTRLDKSALQREQELTHQSRKFCRTCFNVQAPTRAAATRFDMPRFLSA